MQSFRFHDSASGCHVRIGHLSASYLPKRCTDARGGQILSVGRISKKCVACFFHCKSKLLMSSKLTVFFVSFFCLLAGCGEQPKVRQYTVEAPAADRVVTSDVLRSQFPVIPFRWSVPKDWRSASNDQFSVVAWSTGPAKSPKEARITLSELPGSAGLEPQITRWRAQVSMPEADPVEAMKSVETIPLGKDQGSWIELRGPQETILGLIIADSGKLWIFKYRSTNDTAAQERADFRQFCETLQIEKSGRS